MKLLLLLIVGTLSLAQANLGAKGLAGSRNAVVKNGKGDESQFVAQQAAAVSTAYPAVLPAAATHSNIFSSFVFKGFILVLSKSLMDLKSTGYGVKIPLTASFPNYDRLVYLPKATAFIGASYPLAYRVSLAMTVPLQVIYAFVFMVLRNTDYFLKGMPQEAFLSLSLIDWSKYVRPGEAVTRIGFSADYRFNKKVGYHNVVGANFNYIASKWTVTHVLPLVGLLPVVVLALWLWFFAILTFAFPKTNPFVHPLRPSTAVNRAWQLISGWFQSHSPACGVNNAYYRANGKYAWNSAAFLELSQFRPVKNFFTLLFGGSSKE